MWSITNKTPFAAHGYPVRDANGAEHWGVAVRATFDLSDGDLPRVAAEQVPVRLVPLYDETGEEMLEDADLMPFREGCDVLIGAVAHPPAGTQPDSFEVRLRVGGIDKRLMCHGPRARHGDGRLEARGPAEAMPITWRAALGGIDATGDDEPHESNPIGTGWISDPRKLARDAQVDLPRFTGLNADDTPVSLGALPPHWAARRDLAGTFDDTWERKRAPRFPTDFDPRFYNTAPADQVAPLKGGETLRLDGVDPAGPVSLRLPQAILTARTRIAADRIDHRFTLGMVRLDLTAARLTMVWTTATPCSGRDAQVHGSTVRLSQISGAAVPKGTFP